MRNASEPAMSIRDRLLAVFNGVQPDRIPFIDRANLWYEGKNYSNTMPAHLQGKTLAEVHKASGLGHLDMLNPVAHRLKGVQSRRRFNGGEVIVEDDPVLPGFPGCEAPEYVDYHCAGITDVEFVTPVGALSLQWEVTEDMLPMGGIHPYLKKHLLSGIEDAPIAEWIIDHMELVTRFDEFNAAQEAIGPDGFVMPALARIPFQGLLLEYFGEVALFYALADHKEVVERLLEKLDRVTVEYLHSLADLDVPYVEFIDNIDGTMTNRELFERYAVPAYRRYTEILHAQGKKVGSHMDGSLGPLLESIRNCSLDVIESVCPAPMTTAAFEEFWDAWKEGGPIIWGGIPSTLLDAFNDEAVYHQFINDLLDRVGNKPIILGISDMLIGDNLIERVEYTAQEIEKRPLDKIITDSSTVATPTPISTQKAIAQSTHTRGKSEGESDVEDLLDQIYDLTFDGVNNTIEAVVKQGLARGIKPEEMLFEALVPALEEVGILFESGQRFVPDMLLSARAMGDAMSILRPLIAETGTKPLGKIVFGTVRGDVHDIGKDLCITMMEGAGFQIIDLGVNVREDDFVAAVKEHQPDALGISALLTTTSPMIGTTIEALIRAGLRKNIKILIGGAAVTEAFVESVGAEGYALDASAAVRVARQVLGITAATA